MGNNSCLKPARQQGHYVRFLISYGSHLMGMFYRTLRIIDNGIKPLYVFDGAPPLLKNGEVALVPFRSDGSWQKEVQNVKYHYNNPKKPRK